jgi:hypothetical protein
MYRGDVIPKDVNAAVATIMTKCREANSVLGSITVWGSTAKVFMLLLFYTSTSTPQNTSSFPSLPTHLTASRSETFLTEMLALGTPNYGFLLVGMNGMLAGNGVVEGKNVQESVGNGLCSTWLKVKGAEVNN